jgi:peroxiredoxin
MTMKMTGYQPFLLITLLFLVACGSQQKEKEEAEGSESGKKAEKKKENASRGNDQLAELGIDVDARIPKGLRVGDEAPAFSGITGKGDSVQLQELLKEGPLVLFFYRGEWCPICNSYLKRYSDSLKLVQEAGGSVLGVTPEGSAEVERMKEKSAGPIPILPDTSYRVMEAYRVKFRVTEDYVQKIDEKLDSDIRAPGSDSTAFLPVPATYLIDRDGRIAWRHFDPDYKTRASVRSILNAIERLES